MKKKNKKKLHKIVIYVMFFFTKWGGGGRGVNRVMHMTVWWLIILFKCTIILNKPSKTEQATLWSWWPLFSCLTPKNFITRASDLWVRLGFSCYGSQVASNKRLKMSYGGRTSLFHPHIQRLIHGPEYRCSKKKNL